MLNIITNGYVLTIYHEAKFSQTSPDFVRIQGPSQDLALSSCIQPLLGKNTIKRVEKTKSLGFYSHLFLVRKPYKNAASHRPQQTQYLSCGEIVQDGNTRVHQRLSCPRGLGVFNRPIGCLSPYPHPPNLKEVLSVQPHVSNVSVHLSSFWFSHPPPPHTFIVKEMKLAVLSRGIGVY